MERPQLVVEIAVNNIHPDQNNLRKLFDKDDIVALGLNMKELGQLEPIKVFANENGTFDLLDGERRWRAALALGIPTLKAIIEDRPSKETLICKRISRALQTRGLSKQEEVRAIEDALSELGIRDNPEQWAAYAEKLGGNLEKVRERMRVANLPPDLRNRFDTKELDYSLALHISRIPAPSRQREVVSFVTEHNLTARFVATQFIPRLLENPDTPLIGVYELARHQERWRYAKPARTLTKEQTTIDKLDDIISSLIKAEQALEEASASGTIGEIAGYSAYSSKLVQSVRRLAIILDQFLQAYEVHFGEIPRELDLPTLQSITSPQETTDQ